MAPGQLCCGSGTTSECPLADSLQGEGEVVLAGLAVAHQVAGLLAQPQQRLRICPADGSVVPAAGRRGTGCARQGAGTAAGISPRTAAVPAPWHLARDDSQSGRGMQVAAPGLGDKVQRLPLGSRGVKREHHDHETGGRDEQAERQGQGRK